MLRDLRQNVIGGFFFEILEDVGAIVRCHLRDELCRLPRAHRFEHFASQIFVQVLEHVGRAIGTQRAQQFRYTVPRHRLGDVGKIGRVDLFCFCCDTRRFFVEKIENVGCEQCDYSLLFIIARRRVQGTVPLLLHHTTGSVRGLSRKSATS